jgi:hypothetical protein
MGQNRRIYRGGLPAAACQPRTPTCPRARQHLGRSPQIYPRSRDAARFADSAGNRLLYRYALPLYLHAADAGDKHATLWLAGLLAERGDLDEAVQILRTRAGDGPAAVYLAGLLAQRGDLEELCARADADDG